MGAEGMTKFSEGVVSEPLQTASNLPSNYIPTQSDLHARSSFNPSETPQDVLSQNLRKLEIQQYQEFQRKLQDPVFREQLTLQQRLDAAYLSDLIKKVQIAIERTHDLSHFDLHQELLQNNPQMPNFDQRFFENFKQELIKAAHNTKGDNGYVGIGAKQPVTVTGPKACPELAKAADKFVEYARNWLQQGDMNYHHFRGDIVADRATRVALPEKIATNQFNKDVKHL